MLFEEANKAKVSVSLATVYNSLNQFTKVALLRQVAIDASKSYFDTNNTEHHHFYIEDQHELLDVPDRYDQSAKLRCHLMVMRSSASMWWYVCAARVARPHP